MVDFSNINALEQLVELVHFKGSRGAILFLVETMQKLGEVPLLEEESGAGSE